MSNKLFIEHVRKLLEQDVSDRRSQLRHKQHDHDMLTRLGGTDATSRRRRGVASTLMTNAKRALEQSIAHRDFWAKKHSDEALPALMEMLSPNGTTLTCTVCRKTVNFRQVAGTVLYVLVDGKPMYDTECGCGRRERGVDAVKMAAAGRWPVANTPAARKRASK